MNIRDILALLLSKCLTGEIILEWISERRTTPIKNEPQKMNHHQQLQINQMFTYEMENPDISYLLIC